MTLAPHLSPSHSATSSHWLAFGCVIASDVPLSRLPSAKPCEPASVTIHNSGRQWRSSAVSTGAQRAFVRETTPHGVRYVADGIGEFLIAADGRTITYSLAPGAPEGDLQHVLTGPALVMALQVQGRFFLHAAAVEYEGRMVALSAPHGFGKSTLSASFIDAGLTVHSDDVVPLSTENGVVTAHHGQPWIKLWDNALGESGRDASHFDEVLQGLGKRVVPGLTAQGKLPLRCVYLLAPHLREEQPITFEPLRGVAAAVALMANVYSPEIMAGALAARTLDFAGHVANRVPIRVVSYYRSFESLRPVREAILRDSVELTE